MIMGYLLPPLFEPFGFCEEVGVKVYQFAVQIHAKLWPHSPTPPTTRQLIALDESTTMS